MPGELVNGQSGAGMVNVIYGSASGLSATAVPDQRFFQDYSVPGDPSSNMADSSEPNDHFGASLAAGDLDDNGSDDLLIGIPLEDISAGDQGAVAAIYGSPSGLSAAAVPDQVWVGNNRLGGVQSMASGDFDNDGFGDLAMGQPSFDFSQVFFELHPRGAATVLYGSTALRAILAATRCGRRTPLAWKTAQRMAKPLAPRCRQARSGPRSWSPCWTR